MGTIAFIDIEVNVKSKKIEDIGVLTSDGMKSHSTSNKDLLQCIQTKDFICGHNIFVHDIPIIEKQYIVSFDDKHLIDTLHWSPLLFPTKPYHHLLKDDKLQTEELNNPLNDCLKARDLLQDEISSFHKLDDELKSIYYSLLKEKKEFLSFFKYIGYKESYSDPITLIRKRFKDEICDNVDELAELVSDHPIELAYVLSLISIKSKYSITPPWVLRTYPEIENVFRLLRNTKCSSNCNYCNQKLDAKEGLKKYFGYPDYRKFEGKSLQEDAVNAAINNDSILAIFPTGGGKSITFQVPALMSGDNVKGLTVVISPLQSLMKDQVDNLEKSSITDAVTINGLLDPIERAKSFERVEEGKASLLYISPESLRSRSIERLLLGRNVVRFVIDEAHCFSSWGQDFRVDYLYIADFIKNLQEKKNLDYTIPISCFTATAKKQVVNDIKFYFASKLSLDLKEFSSKASRTNLSYQVIPKKGDKEKYAKLRELLEAKQCPTIVYVSRTKKAYKVAEQLNQDGFCARAYHGKMDKNEKSENQELFINGEVDIMVATSAFGMGVDKSDVRMVVHFEVSDSLENYVQEAGRAGRDQSLTAECFVLFNEEDLDKHFLLLNQTKLNFNEIKQIWSAIKQLSVFRNSVSNSALEIARKAGWDDSIKELETRVTTAIAALEDAGYVKRGQNMPQVFADSIQSKNAQEAIDKIYDSPRFNEAQKQNAIRVIKKLFSSKTRIKEDDEKAETRVDYISDHLGLSKEEVIESISLMREEGILSDAKDLTAFIKREDKQNTSLNILKWFIGIEKFLMNEFTEEEGQYHIKELNEKGEAENVTKVNPQKIKTILNFWVITNCIKRKKDEFSNHHLLVKSKLPRETFKEKINLRYKVAQFIVEYLFIKSNEQPSSSKEILIHFSVLELLRYIEFKNASSIDKIHPNIKDVEDALFYLSRIDAIKIDGGFLITYNKIKVDRIEKNNAIKYKKSDYKKLEDYYQSKTEQIHIVGEYANKMIDDYKAALQFTEDYFHLEYADFLKKYFKGNKGKELKQNITPAKYEQLFGGLSITQNSIITDNKSEYISVLAGPGSGKTRVLVHKLASLILMEDVKHEQLLMLTFSRAAATEFKMRLKELIGNAVYGIEIMTFHSYCFEILGRVGDLEKAKNVIASTVEMIRSKEIEPSNITKTVLVIDEAQDMDQAEFDLVSALMEVNDDMRVIMVGDDDQNIYEFRGASSKYLENFIHEHQAKKIELTENYRSDKSLVEYSNEFVQKIQTRLKETPIIPKSKVDGTVELTKYSSAHLTEAVVRKVYRSELKGSTCILTHYNVDALQIAGMLNMMGKKAKLIQTNEGFNLFNLYEIRAFITAVDFNNSEAIIDNQVWKDAINKIKIEFKDSPHLEICLNITSAFHDLYPKIKYKSDLEIFIKESKLEDFINSEEETILVSTIHKSKGKEFDNVFIMLKDKIDNVDAKKRELYVAFTRAKHNLFIHTNKNYLNNISIPNLIWKQDDEQYEPSKLLLLQTTHKDLWLSYFVRMQTLISKLKTGDELTFDNEGCYFQEQYPVLKFSKAFQEELKKYEMKGYTIRKVKVSYIVYWWCEEHEQEVKIVLPEVLLRRG
ncbi:RecQ family ATP-dependent DNA helicase [Flammeovirga sp. MY04]|uniref:RecQ family ATP-dependent DNA helicase n=1 Tax=Flammeovirga sp. MY04 TaxID=1191459 RepID=UPI0008062C23|nr:RecQ family ATP-dependent DNA helicase [Flammeovirga sp. MY04]ANQ48055.1 RecQ family ATP-dependent DNA helicase [Flammeovirga sp. MY04]